MDNRPRIAEEQNRQSRLVIVSNRLPFTVSPGKHGLEFRESAGGLATALGTVLASLKENIPSLTDHLWVGWPGNTVTEKDREEVKARSLANYNSHPVFLTEDQMEHFYHGFCNRTIWPLFHYFPSFASYSEEDWLHYRKVNQIFCDTLLETSGQDDLLWIHDYHLMLLPALMKARRPETPIGFFLHIPFPSFEIFRLLPRRWRVQILEGLLGADLIGFHTYAYVQHFLQSVLRIVGYEHTLGDIRLPDRLVRVGAFPLGIDYAKFHEAVREPGVQEARADLLKNLGERKIIASVDRLDYTKGVLNRLQAMEVLLERDPDLHGKVTMLLVVVPSRIGVEHYEQMKRSIEEIVGKINGKFGGVGWTPIVYQYRNLPFDVLMGIYTVSDVALITPLRDGMNLVAKEYVASRSDQTGVLILSEMAGAAKELGEAITINPNNREEIVDALKEALRMPVEEQKRRNTIMQSRLRRYDVHRWAADFIDGMMTVREAQNKLYAKLFPDSIHQTVRKEYASARRRLLLLDYDGTLVPLVQRPDLAAPDERTIALLRTLSEHPGNTVVVISGRDKTTLDRWFGHTGANLVAEHGVWIKKRSDPEWRMLSQFSNDWKAHIRPIFELYADRLPGAFVEEKDYVLTWHYRTADPEQGPVVARELADHVTHYTANIDIQVIRGNKVIEARNAGANKGAAVASWLKGSKYDFVLALGDDNTDEDMFSQTPPYAYSIRVGVINTCARFNLRNPTQVIQLLWSLAE
jgi:trehalose 6-phosphate synthase/phosphatase